MRKEIFGPVLPVNIINNLDQAIELANDSEYGLTSSIYTNDIRTAMRACNELTFGETYINRENPEAMQGFHAGNRKSGTAARTASTASSNIQPRISATCGTNLSPRLSEARGSLDA